MTTTSSNKKFLCGQPSHNNEAAHIWLPKTERNNG